MLEITYWNGGLTVRGTYNSVDEFIRQLEDMHDGTADT